MDPDEHLADDPLRPIGVVAFDFDGTLTVRDSFTDFLSWNAGALTWMRGLVALAPAAVRYLVNRDPGLLKGAVARRFLAGTPLHDLEARARAYAEARSRSLLRPDALQAPAASYP
jgi:phosphatidylglycerophosphatase C